MMAIARNPNEYAFVHALEEPNRRGWLSRRAVVALGVNSVLREMSSGYDAHRIESRAFRTRIMSEAKDRIVAG